LSTIDKGSHNTQKEIADKLGWSTGKGAWGGTWIGWE